MKVKEYREMMKYLTRPGTPDQGQKDMETQVKKSVENNKNPGTFKKLVLEDEAANRKKNVQGYLPGMEPERVNKIIDTYSDNDPGMEKRGQQTIALTNTANKHLNNQIKKGNVNKDDYILKEDRNGLMVNKNRTIAIRDSFMAKQFNKALGIEDEPMATPKQVGELAERLERNAQMTGGKGPFTKIANNLGKKKPIIKKPFKPAATNYNSFKIDPIMPYYPEPSKPDPQLMELQRRVEDSARRSREDKIREANSGVAGLLKPGMKLYD